MKKSSSEPSELDKSNVEQPESSAALQPDNRPYDLRPRRPSPSSPSTPSSPSSSSSAKRKSQNYSSQQTRRAKKSDDALAPESLQDESDRQVEILFTALDKLLRGSLPPSSSPGASPSAAAKPPVSPRASTPATKRAEHLARLLAQPGHGHTEARTYLLAVLQAFKAIDAQRLGLSKATRESLLEKYSFLEPAVEQLEAVVRNRGPEATLAAKQVPDALCLTFLETALKQLYLIQQIVSKEGGERALYLPTLAVVRSLLQASAGRVTVSMTDSCNEDEDAPEGAAQAEEPTTPAGEPTTPAAAQSTEDADDAAEPVPDEQPSLATLVACEALMLILYEAELRGRHFGGYCEYLFRDTLTQLLRAVMEVKQESTFSGGVYQLLAQLMSALEHNLDENLYQEPDAEVSMDGILTDLGRWLFVRLTATRDAHDPARITDVRMEHSGVLTLLEQGFTKPHPVQSLTVMRMLCTVLLPEASEWSQQEWLGALQAAAANAQDKARLATASTMTAQLAAKDAQLAAKDAKLAAKDAKLAAMQRQLDEMTMLAKN